MSEIRAKYDEEFKKNAVKLKFCQPQKCEAGSYVILKATLNKNYI